MHGHWVDGNFKAWLVQRCELGHRNFLLLNNTSTAGGQDSNSAALNIIYGPVLPGVCGGVVALMTIVGFGEFLRRRRIFQKLRRRLEYKNKFSIGFISHAQETSAWSQRSRWNKGVQVKIFNQTQNWPENTRKWP